MGIDVSLRNVGQHPGKTVQAVGSDTVAAVVGEHDGRAGRRFLREAVLEEDFLESALHFVVGYAHGRHTFLLY
jgi:hypothetical protein